MTGLTIHLTAGELQDWARTLQWFYPPTLKLSTFITLRTDALGYPVADSERPLNVRGYNGARGRLGYGPV